MAWHIRPFKASDKAAVVAISKQIWSGHDHLLHILDEVTTDVHSYPFVLELRGRVVAFANLRVIEPGVTAWMELMRVHPRYRKRGIAWAMTQQLVIQATELKVRQLRLTSMVTNPAANRITSRLGMRQVLQLKVFWKWNFQRLRWKDTSVSVISCTPEEAFHFLQANPRLIPNGLVISYWMAYEVTRSTFQTIGETTQFWKSESNEAHQALSFGFLRKLLDHNEWISTIYALDEPGFLSSLSRQFETAKKHQAAGFMCLHPPQFQSAGIIPGLKRHIRQGTLALYQLQHPFPSFK